MTDGDFLKKIVPCRYLWGGAWVSSPTKESANFYLSLGFILGHSRLNPFRLR
ncbi:hypothetical protein P872_22315 [Rhodonellum psychrophilum GCM71 = DSM 17998]|uniref:Uncharacterized protein n=1 Tax=Rhodonellum psychrophilum GCM71 = DSM 17998 TaxID=1123057 RepID=U5BQI3_9BACT|nr:hypothetical protein P872_22315 [Rhodonellum psychrophilum GCM71 = DSM 17998]